MENYSSVLRQVVAWISGIHRQRTRRVGSAQWAELRNFERLIASLPDHELTLVHADYEYLSSLELTADSRVVRDDADRN